ncbi:MAG: ADP-dependent glucokinase/phosphofructokinase [Candidatus Hodarchaeales archaeon]
MPYVAFWSRKLDKCLDKSNSARGVYCAYNACIDYLEYLDGTVLEEIYKEYMSSELFNRIKNKEIPKKLITQEDFLVALASCLNLGKAYQIPNHNAELKPWFDKIFDEADEHRMGGQSGIIANLLGRLGVKTIIYIPNLSPTQKRQFYKENVFFPLVNPDTKGFYLRNASKCAQRDAITKVNWIFEYEEGTSFPIKHEEKFIVKSPRSNRLIIADRPPGLIPQITDELRPFIPEIGKMVERVILSGYQYLNKANVEEIMTKEREIIDELIKKNPELKIHWEFASIRDNFVRTTLSEKLKDKYHSLGCNEVELTSILHDLGEFEAEKAIKEKETSINLLQGVKIVQKHLDLQRVHLHTLGYHILHLDPNYSPNVSQKSAENALLLSALVGTAKTLVGEFTTRNIRDMELALARTLPVSYNGLREMENFGQEMIKENLISNLDEFMKSGHIEMDGFWTMIIPSQRTSPERIKSTVGLGDSISSIAFVFDRSIP